MILFLNEITTDLYPHVGEKARSLAILYQQYRYYIPASFVIDYGVDITSVLVQKRILAAFDLFQVDAVAVRASSVAEDEKTHSLSGKCLTVLNTSRDQLLTVVQSVMASGPAGYSVNVIVQPMLHGAFSGICHSWGTQGDNGKLLIEMISGMSHNVAGNQLVPISLNLNRCDEAFSEQIQKIKNKLSISAIANNELITTILKELRRTVLELERVFGGPVNIEWCWSYDKLYILKCQPVVFEKKVEEIAISNSSKTKSNKLSLMASGKLVKPPKGNFHYNESTQGPLWMMEHSFNIKSSKKNVSDYPCFFTSADKYLKKNNNTYQYFTRSSHSDELSINKIEKMMGYADHCYSQQREYFDYLVDCDFDNMKTKVLLNHFEQALSFYANHIALYSATEPQVLHFVYSPLLDEISHDELLSLLKPDEDNLIVQEKNDWQQLLSEPFSPDSVLAHIKKYPFIAFSYYSAEQQMLAFEAIYYQQKSISSDASTVNNANEVVCHKTRILSKYPEFKSKVNLINRISINRERMKNGWIGIGYFLNPLFHSLAKRYNETVDDILKTYRVNDIKRLIMYGDKLDSYVKMQRTDNMIWLSSNGLLTICQGISAKKITYRLEKVTQNVSDLSGIIASKGSAKGKAVIVHSDDIKNYQKVNDKFKDGDILVSDVTQPNMYDLIKRSSAVITNEGGLLSHAAVICREINIPCLVQVSGATTLINDGQIVELIDGELKIVSGW
ncbi:PEP-utilizing enzyme [Yersinia mollaretii]|uniref:PEP-utilizing enzyme n=1 Tax=Yersinia mollaretii TaxID=33060 RepID=UPI0005E58B05|nr:PEP-utilizing enzyme [Yersinia mollaretii]PJE86161.1 hypothetical protein CU280_19540 [Yersinia mollaretii]CQD43366.1 phosphoenolpyruvate synthase [Yersinia mollaretii]CQH06427.1 phosphoenolpyruvate synthase [Yersinia mollaretii]